MLAKLMTGVRQFQGEKYHPMQGVFELLSKGQNPEILFRGYRCNKYLIVPLKTFRKAHQLVLKRVLYCFQLFVVFQ